MPILPARAIFLRQCRAALISGILAAGLAPAQAAKVQRSYFYYPVSAASKEALLRALAQTGPYLAETGSRHAAAARIRFQDRLKLTQNKRRCFVEQADIYVYAKIFMPQWRMAHSMANSARHRETALFWQALSADIKRHEARHIAIAYSYAVEMEQELRSLPARKNCARLRADIDAALARLLRNAEAEQTEFDRAEGARAEQKLKTWLRQNGRPKP